MLRGNKMADKTHACPGCGREYYDFDNYCPACGKQVSDIVLDGSVCRYCGGTIPSNEPNCPTAAREKSGFGGIIPRKSKRANAPSAAR